MKLASLPIQLGKLPMAGLAVLSALIGTSRVHGDAPAEIVWHKSYAEARQVANDTGKALLFEFR